MLSEDMYVLEWRGRNNQPERLTLCLVRFQPPDALSLDTDSCQVYNLLTAQLKVLDAANGGRDCAINRT